MNRRIYDVTGNLFGETSLGTPAYCIASYAIVFIADPARPWAPFSPQVSSAQNYEPIPLQMAHADTPTQPVFEATDLEATIPVTFDSSLPSHLKSPTHRTICPSPFSSIPFSTHLRFSPTSLSQLHIQSSTKTRNMTTLRVGVLTSKQLPPLCSHTTTFTNAAHTETRPLQLTFSTRLTTCPS